MDDASLSRLIGVADPTLARRLVDDRASGDEAFRRLLAQQGLPDPGEADDSEIDRFAVLASGDADLPIGLGLAYAIVAMGPAFRKDDLAEFVGAFGEERVERALLTVGSTGLCATPPRPRPAAADVQEIGRACLGLWSKRRLGILSALWQRLAAATRDDIDERLALPLADGVFAVPAPSYEAAA